MPLTWKIDAENQLMTGVGEGDITRAEVDAFLDAMDNGGAMPFRKIFEARFATTTMAPENILALGARMRGYHATGANMGPLALVLPPDKVELVQRVIGMLAIADRPMKVFTSTLAARRWLKKQPLDEKAPDKTGRRPGRPKKIALPA
jgi:hypothetical protein